MSELLTADDEAAAVEHLHALGCTDGLPVVVPTPERVERMVLAIGHPAETALGEMGPLQGVCTAEKLATAAVMAGCLPDHLPIVVAAALAIMDPAFDLAEMQGTTHSTAPLIIVNGPARHMCGVASGYGALGPGHRANASIGRALRLAMINIGGARPGTSDMALLGHGGKFGQCLAEDEEHSTFVPLHVHRGFAADSSTVTVIGTEPPQSVVHTAGSDVARSTDRLLEGLAEALVGAGSNNGWLGGGQAVIVITPDHLGELVAAGHDRASVGAAIADRAQTRDGRPAFASPDDVIVVAAGGSGLYSYVLPTWCAGAHRSRAVSRPVEIGQACALPGA
ncbi:MAG: hypothetical protein AAGA90_13485 [Actinomycetota bacterium]